MATHFSILVWEIPEQRESLAGYHPGGCKESHRWSMHAHASCTWIYFLLWVWKGFSHNVLKYIFYSFFSLFFWKAYNACGCWHLVYYPINLICCFIFFFSLVFLLFWLGDFHYSVFHITTFMCSSLSFIQLLIVSKCFFFNLRNGIIYFWLCLCSL